MDIMEKINSERIISEEIQLQKSMLHCDDENNNKFMINGICIQTPIRAINRTERTHYNLMKKSGYEFPFFNSPIMELTERIDQNKLNKYRKDVSKRRDLINSLKKLKKDTQRTTLLMPQFNGGVSINFNDIKMFIDIQKEADVDLIIIPTQGIKINDFDEINKLITSIKLQIDTPILVCLDLREGFKTIIKKYTMIHENIFGLCFRYVRYSSKTYIKYRRIISYFRKKPLLKYLYSIEKRIEDLPTAVIFGNFFDVCSLYIHKYYSGKQMINEVELIVKGSFSKNFTSPDFRNLPNNLIELSEKNLLNSIMRIQPTLCEIEYFNLMAISQITNDYKTLFGYLPYLEDHLNVLNPEIEN